MNLNKPARIISEMFNGFVMMIATPIVAICIISSLSVLSKILLSLAYILVTIIPFVVLKKLGKVSDYEFTKREERPAYFTIVTIGYMILFLVSSLLIHDYMLIHVSLALFTTTCVLTIVNLYWKMSGHMTYSTLFFFSLIFLFPYATYLPLLFIATPFIAVSRVILKKHTVLQVIIGTLVSALLSILILWVI